MARLASPAPASRRPRSRWPNRSLRRPHFGDQKWPLARALSRLSTYALMAMKAGADSRDLVPPLLRNRVFRRYWGASTVSMFGDQVSSVAIPLTAVLVLHARAYEMGVLTALQWLPSLLFGLHAGRLGGPAGQAAPRHDPRRRRPGGGVRDDTAVLRAARADLRADVRGHVRGRLAFRAVHRVRRDPVRLDRGDGRVRRRPVADLRQPGAFLSRRAVGRRAARAGAERAVRHRGRTPCRSSGRPSSSA